MAQISTDQQFSIFVKNKQEDDWHSLRGSWYISPSKAVASYKNSVYAKKFSEFADIKIVQRDIVITDSDMNIKDLSKYGIHLTEK